jgi:hypothetical protein
MIQSIDLRSFTPAKAGPVNTLLILWQEAQRVVKIVLPSSIGGAAFSARQKIIKNADAKNLELIF